MFSFRFRSRGDGAGGHRAAGNPVARFDPVARFSAWPIRRLFHVAAAWFLAGGTCFAQITLTASPSTIVQGQSSTLTTTVQVQGPLGPYTLPHSDVVTPAATQTYTASIPGSTVTATVTVTPPPPPPAALVSDICKVTGSVGTSDLLSTCGAGTNVPGARGYNWKFAVDPVSHEVLLYEGSNVDVAIYSYQLWSVNPATGAIRLRYAQSGPDNASVAGHAGPPGSTLLLKGGHPLGKMTVDPIHNQWLAEVGLALGYNNAFTSRFDLAANVPMLPASASELGAACDGTYNCGTIAWDSGFEFIKNYGKAISCCNGGSYWHLKITEYDPVTATYADVSALQMGADGISCENGSAQCPTPLYNGRTLMSDDDRLWVLGGCNTNDCPSTGRNELFVYDPRIYTWTHLTPSGTLPPVLNGGFPAAFLDSARHRIVWYADTDAWWQYSLVTNTWSTFTPAGHGPVFDAYLRGQTGSVGAAYEPASQCGVIVYSRGQGVSPGISKICFSSGS